MEDSRAFGLASRRLSSTKVKNEELEFLCYGKLAIRVALPVRLLATQSVAPLL